VNTVVANGLVIGAIYGLVALGLTLIYKKSRVLNFAHGEVGMVGAFVFYVALVERELPYLVAAFIGIAVASHLLKAGVNIKIVSRRLGHASVSFTLDKYSHLMPDDDQQAAVAVATLVDASLSTAP
jgi:branched-subunit amino acid ABC-type transport system permease component